jgi:hypothetical protein
MPKSTDARKPKGHERAPIRSDDTMDSHWRALYRARGRHYGSASRGSDPVRHGRGGLLVLPGRWTIRRRPEARRSPRASSPA